jgi:hypothetical protein
MACKQREDVVSFVLGELSHQNSEPFHEHVKHCPECHQLLQEFEETGNILGSRTLPSAPDRLVDDCLLRIRRAGRDQKASIVERFFLPRFRPGLQWAAIIVVFFMGLGLGKLLFQPPAWLERYGRSAQNRAVFLPIDDNRAMRSYLLSVEMLLLDLSNMDDPALLDDDEWDIEIQITREILQRTRQIKDRLGDGDRRLYQLVVEIEWVLEDVLGTANIDVAGLPPDVRRAIDDQQLLTKIHEYIS